MYPSFRQIRQYIIQKPCSDYYSRVWNEWLMVIYKFIKLFPWPYKLFHYAYWYVRIWRDNNESFNLVFKRTSLWRIMMLVAPTVSYMMNITSAVIAYTPWKVIHYSRLPMWQSITKLFITVCHSLLLPLVMIELLA